QPPTLPLTLQKSLWVKTPAAEVIAPPGRLIPAETVFPLESSQLDAPLIGLVTEDVWYQGKVLIPAGAELHGQIALDRQRERLTAQGRWQLIRENQPTLALNGLLLARETDPGTLGLGGQALRSSTHKAARLFAATFLSTATAALQETRTTSGPLGETVSPISSARNASLAGTSAVLRDYAEQVREAVAQDGIYLRVRGGTPFYLYVRDALALPATSTHVTQ
ncbi:MAG: TrbI/VirB10 family protein, partial [Cephaloticoccus sp.]|nr:TrbI/VirB10 family protein [Cephaloticoccus sp.]